MELPRTFDVIMSKQFVEDKVTYLEHPIPVAPVAAPGHQVPPEALAAHAAWVKGSKEIVVLMLMTMDLDIQRNLEHLGSYDMLQDYIDNLERLSHPVSLNLVVSLILVSLSKEYDSFVQNYNMHSMGKTVNELHAMLKLHVQTLPKKDDVLALYVIRAGKNPPPPKKDNPAKDTISHQCCEVGHWRRNYPVYLAGLLKKKKLSQGASTSGLKGSKKLKPGALSLYVGDGHCAGVEAIGEYYLCLPSGLVLILHKCHYAPSITRGIISVSRLYNDGFVNRFENDNILSVSRNNLVYFYDIPRDGIYEIDLSSSNINDSSMYAVSNKRAKINLDSSLLWHCRLGHISKKRIEKLQHDGLLNSTDIKAFEKCVSCMSRKMARKPYSHQVERAKDLLGLIHTDVCGPFRTVSRQGASYFITFTDNFSRYGYVYLLKHKHEVFETFKVFQKEVENQLGKSNKLLHSDRGGYPKETMGYFFYYPPENKVFVAWNVEFFKNSLITQEASESLEDLEIIQEEDTQPSIDTSLHHDEDDQEINEPQSDINPIRKSTRTRRAPDRMCLHVDAEEHKLGDLGDPANYKVALLDHESDKWLDVMNVEMKSMKDNEVWDLVDLPPNGKTIGSKWLFKKKSDMDGSVHTFKTRLVAKGFTQTYEVNYEETFYLVADIRAIRILIAIVMFYDYEIWKMDVKTAFLNGHLSEEVYMVQPEGFVTKFSNEMQKLKRSIYGSSKHLAWNIQFDDEN
ncbi:retrotransposon protein, putative, ty1-copia subclass [Tanacetum coccineum]